MRRECTVLPPPSASLKLQITSGRGNLSNSEQVQKGIFLNTANIQNHVGSSRVRSIPPFLSPLNEL